MVREALAYDGPSPSMDLPGREVGTGVGTGCLGTAVGVEVTGGLGTAYGFGCSPIRKS